MKSGSEPVERELSGREPTRREPSEHELLIVGAGGMLGTALVRVAPRCDYVPRAYTEEALDITDRAAVNEVVTVFATRLRRMGVSGAIVNAAAYTDVERAEDDAERAFLINEHAAGWLADVAGDKGLAFVHVSTDFVFDGTKRAPYTETDDPNPLSVYGASKFAGEQTVLASNGEALVVRTAWTYGLGGANFPVKILQRARSLTEGAAQDGVPAGPTTPTLQVVADEIGSPTYAVDLATGLLTLLSGGATGLFHLAGAGSCSRYELALETLRLAGFEVPADLDVEPVSSTKFPTKAVRPPTAVMDCSKAAGRGVRLPAWRNGLARFLAEL